MSELIKLFTTFFRIGLFTFGGGYAMLPMLEREIVEKNNWSTRADILDYFAISQCIPGIIAANTATIIGYTRRRAWGALFATVGVISPSIIIITIIAAALSNFMDYQPVMSAFAGVRAGVTALIFAAAINLFKSNVLLKVSEKDQAAQPFLTQPKALKSKDGKSALFCRIVPLALCLAAFLIILLGASPAYVVVGAALLGLLLYGKVGM